PREVGIARDQLEALRPGDGGPEPVAAADGAVAAIARLREVEIDEGGNLSAMAGGAVALQHWRLLLQAPAASDVNGASRRDHSENTFSIPNATITIADSQLARNDSQRNQHLANDRRRGRPGMR